MSDTTVVQALINNATNGRVDLVAGTVYVIDYALTVPSTRRIFGNGATLKMKASYGAEPLLKNANTSDSNIYIEDVIFDGNGNDVGSTQTRSAPNGLCSFSQVTGLHLNRCVFQNLGYSGAYISRSTDITVEHCEFTGLGSRSTQAGDAERGCTLYIASYGSSPVQFSERVLVANNYFHDNYWCVQVSCLNGSIVGNRLINNKESGIYMPYDHDGGTTAPTYVAENMTICANVIDGVETALISGSGIECHLRQCVIADNTIRNTWSHGIALTRGRNVVIEGNAITLAGVKINGVTPNPNASGISLISGYKTTGATGDVDSYNVVIRNNRIYDGGAANQTMRYGISAANMGTAGTSTLGVAKFTTLLGNDFGNATWAPGATIGGTVYPAGKTLSLATVAWDLDTSVAVQGLVAWSGSWALTTTAGAVSFTSCPFRPNSMIIDAYQDSTTGAYSSRAHVSIDPPASSTPRVNGFYTAGDAGGHRSKPHSNAVSLVQGNGTAIYTAVFGQFLENGFSINVQSGAAANCVAKFTLFP